MCIMAYTTVLFMEFLSPVCEKLGYHVPLRVLRWLEMPLVIGAASISTLHQSSLGTFFLIAVDKLHALWYNPLLPLLFWLSAIFTGISIIILEATMVHRFMGQPDESELLEVLTKILPWVLGVYLVVKLGATTLLSHGPLFDRPSLLALFVVEIIIGVIVPMFMFMKQECRENQRMQLRGASLVIFGLVLNRFNVSMFGMEQADQAIYYPSIIESLVTIGIIAAHVLFFVLLAKYFPIFEHHPETVDYSIPDHAHSTTVEHGHAHRPDNGVVH